MARWMSDKGARNIVLTSRNASITEKVQELSDYLASTGTTLVVKPCDVANKESVTKLIREDLKDLPPVRGVIHGAMVLKVNLVGCSIMIVGAVLQGACMNLGSE